MEEQIDDRMRQTRQKLLENFDEEVHEKLRVSLKESSEYLDRYETWLWALTRYFLAPYADFEEGRHGFVLRQNPFPEEHIHPGPYRSGGAGQTVEDANLYRVGHPLAQKVITRCRDIDLGSKTLTFRYSGAGKRISILDELAGQEGWLTCDLLTVSAFESQDHILFAGCTDAGAALTAEQCRRCFSLVAEEELSGALPPPLADDLSASIAQEKDFVIAGLNLRNNEFFDQELDKLDRWGDDRRATLKERLRDLENAIKVIKREARLAPNLPLKLKLEREKRNIETNRDEAWKEYEEAARDIEERKDSLIDEVEKKLSQHLSQKTLFSIRWRIQ
jgi:hypothetical protein